MRTFDHFAAIDWSGENVARPKGLAVAITDQGDGPPALLRPDGGWSRSAIAEWMIRLAEARTSVILGLDLSPALPHADAGAYFPGWEDSPATAKDLWAMVDERSSVDDHLSALGFLTDREAARHFRFQHGAGDLFPEGVGRMRVCEEGQRAMGMSPYSCFNLIGAAQVGKSSLTGMRILHRINGKIPVWPFDPVPKEGPLVVEIYTSIAARAAGIRKGLSKIRDRETLESAMAALGSKAPAKLARYDDHSTDAILTAAWLRANAHRAELWSPAAMTPQIAATEGWTFGVP